MEAKNSCACSFFFFSLDLLRLWPPEPAPHMLTTECTSILYNNEPKYSYNKWQKTKQKPKHIVCFAFPTETCLYVWAHSQGSNEVVLSLLFSYSKEIN